MKGHCGLRQVSSKVWCQWCELKILQVAKGDKNLNCCTDIHNHVRNDRRRDRLRNRNQAKSSIYNCVDLLGPMHGESSHFRYVGDVNQTLLVLVSFSKEMQRGRSTLVVRYVALKRIHFPAIPLLQGYYTCH